MIWVILYLTTVVGANWAITTFGLVPVGFGFVAPAGVFFAGLAFTLRDLAHRSVGRWWVIAAIIAGAALSAFLSPVFAIASGAAFILSELADLAVYEPLRKRGLLIAVAASNIVGLVIDSALFLYLAFGNIDFLPGQIIGKVAMTALALIALSLLPKRRLAETV